MSVVIKLLSGTFAAGGVGGQPVQATKPLTGELQYLDREALSSPAALGDGVPSRGHLTSHATSGSLEA